MSTPILPVPEEILERILELAFFSTTPTEPTAAPDAARATHVLLVCKAFERIALPFLYSALHLRTRAQADALAATLAARPALGACVRALRVDSPAYGRAFAGVVRALAPRAHRPLDVLDITLDAARTGGGADAEPAPDAFDAFCAALRRVPDARTLVVRKSGYLTHDSTVRAVSALACGIRMCSSVERVDLKYKPSPLPATLLLATPREHQCVCDPLAAALATLPRLKAVRAQLPAIWNPFLLEVAGNAALDRVELMDRDESAPELDAGTGAGTGAGAAACTGPGFAACEGRLPCRGRGRGMSDVAYAYASSSPLPSSSSSSSSNLGPVSFPQSYSRQPASRPGAACPCSLGATPEMTMEMAMAAEAEADAIPEPCDADVALPPSLFMTQAAKHARLHALILAGRRHMFLARMQARAARVRAEMAAGCVCAGARLMSSSLSHAQGELLPPSPTAFGFGSRTRAHTVLPSATGSRRSGRS